MLTIVVGSTNPVKTAAAKAGFSAMFPGEELKMVEVKAKSGVSDQPNGEVEGHAGALNRAIHARELHPEADYWIGLEGFIAEDWLGMYASAWMVVQDAEGLTGQGMTGRFYLPQVIVDLVKAGKELGEADDIVFKRKNTKQANGAVGILTDDAITRETYYSPAVILALVPFKNREIYK